VPTLPCIFLIEILSTYNAKAFEVEFCSCKYKCKTVDVVLIYFTDVTQSVEPSSYSIP
jgi:hypothetical protein